MTEQTYQQQAALFQEAAHRLESDLQRWESDLQRWETSTPETGYRPRGTVWLYVDEARALLTELSALASERDGARAQRDAALTETRALLSQARAALAYWDRFVWYASGASGHPPISLPPWYALMYEEAVDASIAVVGDTFGKSVRASAALAATEEGVSNG